MKRFITSVDGICRYMYGSIREGCFHWHTLLHYHHQTPLFTVRHRLHRGVPTGGVFLLKPWGVFQCYATSRPPTPVSGEWYQHEGFISTSHPVNSQWSNGVHFEPPPLIDWGKAPIHAQNISSRFLVPFRVFYLHSRRDSDGNPHIGSTGKGTFGSMGLSRWSLPWCIYMYFVV